MSYQKTYLAVQWLRLCTFTASGAGSVPGWRTQILLACMVWQKKKKKKKSFYEFSKCVAFHEYIKFSANIWNSPFSFVHL